MNKHVGFLRITISGYNRYIVIVKKLIYINNTSTKSFKYYLRLLHGKQILEGCMLSFSDLFKSHSHNIKLIKIYLITKETATIV